MFKRALSLIICIIMLTSTFVGTGISASANNEIANEILSQAQAEPIEEPIVPAPEIPTATADKNSSVVVPDTATATYSGTCGDNLTWNLDTATGVLTIDGTGDMYDYLPNSYAPWYSYHSYIESVTIGNSVTSIGGSAFYDCDSLTSVTVPNSVTSIGNNAFESCDSLASVTIPDSVTSIGQYVFSSTAYSNNSSNWTGDVLYIGKHLIIAKSSISGDYTIKDGILTIAASAFTFRKSLTSVTIPDSVTSIVYRAFSYCDSLTIKCYENSYAHTYAVENGFAYELIIPAVVSGTCGDNLTWSLDTTTGVLTINGTGDMYDYGEESYNGSYRTTAPWKYYSSYIKSIVIGGSVTSIGNKAFCHCPSLTSVIIPDSVLNIGSSAFYNTAYYNDNSNWKNDVLYIGNHLIKANTSLSGTYTVKEGTVAIADMAFYSCNALSQVVLPDSVVSIGNSAFYECFTLSKINIPDSVRRIGRYAFNFTSYTSEDYAWSDGALYIDNHLILASGSIDSDYAVKSGTLCIADGAFSTLSSINITIDGYVRDIGEDAFYGSNDITVKCYEGSYTHSYVQAKGIKYELLVCEHIFDNYISDNNSSCADDGTKTAYCENGCGIKNTVIDEGSSMGGHYWSEWIITIEPTYTKEGEQFRYCTLCRVSEIETLPVLVDENKPIITVDNFTVTITKADYIKDMRYALGEYTTTTEIRNAEGNVALDNTIVTEYTVDGCFVYEMPNGGIYSIWIRMKDGTNYILPLNVTNVNASVSSYGVTITLHDIFDVKDFYIAKGEFETYREIKDNGYIFSATSVKIGNKHDYTHTVYEPGMHTILIRYNDGRTAVFHEELTVTEPTFTTNGLQVTVGNIEDVRVIRTAYGEYNTPGEVKRAAGARNFSGRAVIKGADEYLIQYRNNGIVTITVEYNNGYVKVFRYEVTMKQPGFIHNGSTVFFDNLEGMVVIRYAMGTYTTSAEIKRANGSKVIKPADLTGEYAIVSGLAKGTYTFCVQYDDESYNYFTVTVK